MKKFLSGILTFAILCFLTVSAFAESAQQPDDDSKNAVVQNVNFEDFMRNQLSVTRATSRIEWTLAPNSGGRTDTAYPMERDELVTINCTYSPRTADIDFGLLAPNGSFYSLKGEDGSFRKTIRIEESGSYYFAVRNNSNYAVEILGYVYY